MIPFLEKISDRLLKKFPDNMENIAIVLPSKRAVVFFKHYLAKKISKPIFLPDFYSIEEFIENLSGLHVLDNVSLQFRLFETYLKFPNKVKESFDSFLKWSNVLLHDFNDIDRNLVDAKDIYKNLNNAKELDYWSVRDWSFSNENLTAMQADYLSFFESMLDWYNDFSSSLIKDNLAYQGLAYREAAKEIKNSDIIWEKIWFVGLNALTKSEQKIIDYLRKEDIARVFWDADKFYIDNPMHEAGRFLRSQRNNWSEIEFEGVGDYFSQHKDSFNIIACPKNISQAKVASQLIKSLSKDELEDSNTAIVLADEALLFPVLHNLPSEVKQLNVTMGSPLKNTTLFTFVELIFNLQINTIKYNKNAFYYKDLISLVEHPYFVIISNINEIDAFKKTILNQNIVFLDEINIKCFFSDDIIIELLTLRLSNIDIISTIIRLVECLKNHIVRETASVESEVLATFFKSIIILQNLLEKHDFVFELKTLQIIMQQLVAKETIPFRGEPLKGVQLMGILESRTLDFKNVIMLSVNEGKLPKGKSVNSFIPYDIKRHFKLTTYSETDSVFSYHFYRLLQRANNVSLLYNSETDDFGNGEKSRFITQLLAEYDGNIGEYVYKGNDLKLISKQNIVMNNLGLESKIKFWAASGVSPTSLNTYINCSLHFYYRYLAKVRESNDINEYVDSSIMGTAIHNALFINYPIGILTEEYINDKTLSILNDIEKSFSEILSEKSIKEGKNFLNLQIAKQITKQFLRSEKITINKVSFKNQKIQILHKEIELFYDLMVDGINFKLRGKIDRVDFLGDTLRIIDYKTGIVEKNEVLFTDFNELIDNPEKSKAFQLLMYAYLYLKNYPKYIGLDIITANISFKNLSLGLITVSKKINSKESSVIRIDQRVLEDFEAKLKLLLLRIKTNSFSQNSNAKYCSWCDNSLNFNSKV